MNDWRKPCEHGQYDKHRRQGHLDTGDFAYCPGGSPVTAADLFAAIESLTDPRYVIFAEGQMGAAGYFDEIDALRDAMPDRET